MLNKLLLTLLVVLLSTSNVLSSNCVNASWYGPGFHGKKTASGERFNQFGLTAAHKKMQFGTKLKVVNPKNNKYVIVKINDRGPFVKGRSLDLSRAAAKQIGIKSSGHGKVCYQILN